jgi:hypothetical protein
MATAKMKINASLFPSGRTAAGGPGVRRRHGVGLLVVVFVSCGPCLVAFASRANGLRPATASKLQNRLEQENREKVELATLTTRDRLDEMARRRLGLTLPQKGQVIVLP